MKTIPVDDAVGTVLPHDMTKILPGEFKGVGFKKGHIVRAKDVGELKKMGKHFIHVLEISEEQLHEDDAALRIAAAVSGPHIKWTSPEEGKSSIISDISGLLKIDVNSLLEINRIDNIAVSTIKTMTPVQSGQVVAATRVIPLVVDKSAICRVEEVAKRESVIQVLPYRSIKIGAVVTGTEIYNGLVKDGFNEFVLPKIEAYGGVFLGKINVPDDADAISSAVDEFLSLGCHLVVTTGGLSVDPDDVTPKGVIKTGAAIINYGSPVFPGAMVLYARHNESIILGLPACVYYAKRTILDLLLPRIFAGQDITKDTFSQMGHGGFCRSCKVCNFPNCSFGG
jgi:hypothetical protein